MHFIRFAFLLKVRIDYDDIPTISLNSSTYCCYGPEENQKCTQVGCRSSSNFVSNVKQIQTN